MMMVNEKAFVITELTGVSLRLRHLRWPADDKAADCALKPGRRSGGNARKAASGAAAARRKKA